MSSKIEKIITRLQGKITEGQFYEAQQQTRVVAARYVKSSSWTEAIDILYNVASSLLKASQGGSGGDLSLFLVDVYKQAKLPLDSTNKGRLLSLLRQFDAEEPTRKTFINETIGWSSTVGTYPAGDPELHHVAGSLLAEEGFVYEAEKHLLLGTKESAPILGRLEFTWYETDDSHTAAQYAARAVFPYLLIGNVRDAATALRTFTSALLEKNPSLAVQDVSSSTQDLRVYPSLPLLNFLGLLLLAVQKGGADLFRNLKNHYSKHIKELAPAGQPSPWDEPLVLIAEMYFGISRPRQGNPLFDMMGSLMGGGFPGMGMGGGSRKPQQRSVELPEAEGLD